MRIRTLCSVSTGKFTRQATTPTWGRVFQVLHTTRKIVAQMKRTSSGHILLKFVAPVSHLLLPVRLLRQHLSLFFRLELAQVERAAKQRNAYLPTFLVLVRSAQQSGEQSSPTDEVGEQAATGSLRVKKSSNQMYPHTVLKWPLFSCKNNDHKSRQKQRHRSSHGVLMRTKH